MSWASIPLKRIATLTAGGTPSVDEPAYWSDSDGGHAWAAIGDMSSADTVLTTARRISEDGLRSARIKLGEPGTILFSMYATLGHTAWLGTPAAWNQAILGLWPDPTTDARFLRYSLVSLRPHLLEQARSNTQANLNAEQVGNLVISRPPVDEQRRIADFLDAETAEIDQLAQLRHKQLELIAERDAAETYDAVRGATLGIAMHASGLAWLGQVADGFRTAAVSHEFEVSLGKMLNPSRTQGDHLRPYLRNTNVQWDSIDTTALLLMDFPPEERMRYLLRPGDLLVCEGGDPGRAAIWHGSAGELYYQKALHRVRPRGTSTVRWLYYCLRAATYMNLFAVQGNTTTIAHLTGEQLKSQRFPFPERSIQDKVVNLLDELAEDRRTFKAAVGHQLALLAERRQALIAAAVTGQIDVTTGRGVAT